MTDSDDARKDYLALRESASSAQLATLRSDVTPEASYAPCVWYQGNCYVFLSELSSHTGNLMRNPKIGMMLIEDARAASNPFARKRISLHGSARVLARSDRQFSAVLAEFHHRFGAVMKVIEPLPDFHLFRIDVAGGSFVRGFGQAYAISGKNLDQLAQVDPRK